MEKHELEECRKAYIARLRLRHNITGLLEYDRVLDLFDNESVQQGWEDWKAAWVRARCAITKTPLAEVVRYCKDLVKGWHWSPEFEKHSEDLKISLGTLPAKDVYTIAEITCSGEPVEVTKPATVAPIHLPIPHEQIMRKSGFMPLCPKCFGIGVLNLKQRGDFKVGDKCHQCDGLGVVA